MPKPAHYQPYEPRLAYDELTLVCLCPGFKAGQAARHLDRRPCCSHIVSTTPGIVSRLASNPLVGSNAFPLPLGSTATSVFYPGQAVHARMMRIGVSLAITVDVYRHSEALVKVSLIDGWTDEKDQAVEFIPVNAFSWIAIQMAFRAHVSEVARYMRCITCGQPFNGPISPTLQQWAALMGSTPCDDCYEKSLLIPPL